MQISSKNFKALKTKNYIKENNIFFFFNSVYKNSYEGIIIEQNLKKSNLNCYKIFNKTSKTTLNNSIHKNYYELINSMTVLIKPILTSIEFKKYSLIQCFEPLLFNMLAVKLNNKIYSNYQLKEIITTNYKDLKLLLFQFNISNVKLLKI